jgi:peptide/nickel transport system ATP-binding protein
MTGTLRIRGLRVELGLGRRRTTVLRDLDLEVPGGSCLALVGESGSGKSTLARTVAGLIPATRGRIELELPHGVVDLRTLCLSRGRLLRRHVQLVLQDPGSSFDPRQLVGDAIAAPLRALELVPSAKEARSRARETARRLGLDPDLLDRHPHAISGGQRQRAALARALVVEPELLLLDEATSALDQSVKAQVINLLLELRRAQPSTLVLITHDLAVARALADRVAVLFDGEIVEAGPARPVLDDPGHPYTRTLALAALPPDPDRARAVLAAAGSVRTRSASSAEGCRFEPRCGVREPRCREGRVDLLRRGPADWAVRCRLLEPQVQNRV